MPRHAGTMTRAAFAFTVGLAAGFVGALGWALCGTAKRIAP